MPDGDGHKIKTTKDANNVVVYTCPKCGFGTYDKTAAEKHEAAPI